jgi:hypothetical protein
MLGSFQKRLLSGDHSLGLFHCLFLAAIYIVLENKGRVSFRKETWARHLEFPPVLMRIPN